MRFPLASDRFFVRLLPCPHLRLIVAGMDFELRQYERTDIRNEVLCFRPQLQPGHEPRCSGISEKLEIREGARRRCRNWLELLVQKDILG